MTNNIALPALTIGALDKSRWQFELFFKWIKQHLRIKHFLGTSENAVKTQIWGAVTTYVLISIRQEGASTREKTQGFPGIDPRSGRARPGAGYPPCLLRYPTAWWE